MSHWIDQRLELWMKWMIGEIKMIKDKVLSQTTAYIDIYIYIVCIKLFTEEEEKEIANKNGMLHNAAAL
jgi:hypothetical protein